MLSNMKKILLKAVENNRIVPAFNVFGYEDAKIVIEVAEMLNAPALLMTNRDAANFMPIRYYGSLYREMARDASIPVVLHLDHGKSIEEASKAIQAGYTSVMYDGSRLSLEENIKHAKVIYDIANACNVSFEVEVGCVAYNEPHIQVEERLTEVSDVMTMYSEVPVDCIAVAVGNVHRMTERNAVIDFERLDKIRKSMPVPLVIHGSTGISDEQIRKLRYYGIGKMNIGTAVRMAFGNTIRDVVQKDSTVFDRIEMVKEPMEEMRKVIMDKYKQLGW